MGERTRKPLEGAVVARLAAPLAEVLDRLAGWDRLPLRLGIVTLLGIRHRLRERNLYDQRTLTPPSAAGPEARPSDVRSLDGRGTDPAVPWMGAAVTRFGRNGPPVVENDARREEPSPLTVSERLLKRDQFFPAETLNLLAAAWVQFEVHDWFAHQVDPEDPAWMALKAPEGAPSRPPPFKQDPTAHGRIPAFVSDQTHWWDASQLYGAREDVAQAIRDDDGGRVKEDEPLLEAMEGFAGRNGGTSSPVPNLWVGTALFHILFAKEHNAIYDRLRWEYPRWSEDRLYDKARMINAAVMAKIHTVEWTPAIIAHPTTAHGAKAIWYGVLRGRLREWCANRRDEVLTGIPGSRLDHDSVPYTLTEEFVSVYRLHPMIPDEVTFRRVSDDRELGSFGMEQLTVAPSHIKRPRDCLRNDAKGVANAFYSLGLAHPGENTLHNYPKFFEKFTTVDRRVLNLGEVDIRRTREAGVPRYNNFRRMFRLRPARSFHEIANGNPKWAQEIRDVYGGKLEDVDLLIGMLAEGKPQGFAFSDTAFRVFLLMAARRLRSDRFFTTDYTPDVYTPVGFKWIEEATLSGILQRHYPELGAALSRVENPFAPWRTPTP